MKFTGLDTECSLLSKSSPVFRDVSSTKQWSRTGSEPAQTLLWFISQELLSGWLLRGLWALMVSRTDYRWSWSLSVYPHPGLLPKDSPPSLSPRLSRTHPEVNLLQNKFNTHDSPKHTTCNSEIHRRSASFKKGSSSFVTSVWKGSYFPDLAFAQLLRALFSNLNIMLLKLIFFNWGRWNIIWWTPNLFAT